MQSDQNFRKGLILALSAFLLWGLAPIYFKAVRHVSPLEVLSHRILWSVVILLLVVHGRKQWSVVRALTWSTIKPLLLSSVLVSTNWFVFIWAVGQGRVLETSLGYFINPLISVSLAVVFLAERLRPIQWLAIALAALGVVNQIVVVGSLPWVALVLAFSFGFYGLIRKQVRVDPVVGLLLETVLLLPIALAYLAYLGVQGDLMFMAGSGQLDLLLVFAGLVTTVPLLLFAAGTQRLSLTVMGVAQYTAPSMTFLLAVFWYQEAFDAQQLVTFVCIWLGLFVFTLEGLRRRKTPQVV